MGHAYATRCVYKYRVQLLAPTASGNVRTPILVVLMVPIHGVQGLLVKSTGRRDGGLGQGTGAWPTDVGVGDGTKGAHGKGEETRGAEVLE